jgi:hypothetical protein
MSRLIGALVIRLIECLESGCITVVYLLPLDKPFISGKMMRTMKSWGSVKHMRFYGTGTELGFPMGFAVGALHFQKDYHGAMSISYV